MTVSLEIPDTLLSQLVPAGRDAARSILEDSVAEAYRERRLTLHQVKELLGFGTRMEADEFLGAREIFDDYSLDDLDRDAEVLRKLRLAHASSVEP